jgi:hypothetical protein
MLPHDALTQMLDHNQWVPGDIHRDGLITWRQHVAAALRDVPIEPMAEMFCDVIAHLELSTTKRLNEQFDDDPPGGGVFGIEDWHGIWREHFVSWQDPLRDLVDAMAYTPDAKDFTRKLKMADGETFLDFVLDAHLNWSAHQAMARRAGLKCHSASERFPLTLDPFGKERPLLRLYRALFERFAEQLSFGVAPAPERIFLFHDFSRLFPHQPTWTHETSIRGQA